MEKTKYKPLFDVSQDKIKYIFDPNIEGADFLGKNQFSNVFKGYFYDSDIQ
jgi:hypothetical protein